MASVFAAVFLSILAALALYLISRNQRLLRVRPSPLACLVAAFVLLFISSLLLADHLGSAALVFVQTIIVIFIWTALPFVLVLVNKKTRIEQGQRGNG